MKLVCDTIIPPLPTTQRGHGLHIHGTEKKSPRALYCAANLVVQRNLEQTNIVRLNPEHSVRSTVAKFSPNGEWICSGDESGHVAVWAHKSFVVKNTIAVGKSVTDINWSGDGQRIVAVGYGKDEKGKVFPWNTNNKLGFLSGAQKGFLTCDFKPNRPFKVIAGGEDFGVFQYKGPPFTFGAKDTTHTNYVNCLRFTPDGAHYVSCSSDKKILVFDSKTGKLARVLCDGDKKKNQKIHTASIYSLCFNPDGKQFITASADKTCKIWSFESGEVLHTFKPYLLYSDKPQLSDMQVSCLWMNNYLLSVSLSGKINYFDRDFINSKNEKPSRVLTGHQKAICDVDYDANNDVIYTVDINSNIIKTECKTEECFDLIGNPHSSAPLKFVRVSCNGNSFYTVANNDTVCLSPTNDNNKLGDKKSVFKIDGAARGIATGNVNDELCIIPTHRNKLHFIKGINIYKTLDLPFNPTCCDISSDDKYVAIGGKDKIIHFYNIDNCNEEFIIKSPLIRDELSHITFSNDNNYVASADKYKNIWIWDLKNKQYDEPINIKNAFKYHGGTIGSINWSPDSKMLVSAAYDCTIFVWLKPTEGKSDNIHLEPKENIITFIGAVKKLLFISQSRLVGIGADSTVRFIDIV